MLDQQISFTLDLNHQTFQKLSSAHSHDSVEIMFCMSNGGTFFVQDQLIPLYSGTLVIIQGGVDHHCVVDVSSFERYSLRIPSQTIEAISSLQTDFKSVFGKTTRFANLSAEQKAELKQLMDQCLSCGGGFGEDFRKNILFFEIALFIGQAMRGSSQRQEPSISRDYQRIMPAIQFIHDSYADEITLKQLSSLCYMSPYYFSHLFREATGFTMKSYIINYRIRKSCDLLSQGYSVQAAGMAVGFSNSAYFIQTFKQIMGITPKKYVCYG